MFRITQEKSCNIFEQFSRDDYVSMRSKIIAMVLATDISRHFSDLSKFKTKFTTGEVVVDDKVIFLEMIMHACDISNPSKPWSLCHKWADLVLEEYFIQGDLEKSRKLPVSYLCDRETVAIPKS
jgi:hypothetical protein